MRPHTAHLIAALALSCAATAGCGITDPYQRPSAARAAPATAVGPASSTTANDPSERQPGSYAPGAAITTPGSRPLGSAGAATPFAALKRYARIYTNWTASSLSHTERQLAAISLGSARANALQSAASYGHDAILLHSHVANTGTVISIARDDVRPGVWVIVTSQTTTGRGTYAGLPAQLHVTYAQVTDTRRGWEVSAWSPQT